MIYLSGVNVVVYFLGKQRKDFEPRAKEGEVSLYF